MRKLMVTTFVSVDGVMQAPGGGDEDRDGGFEHGGWAVPHIDQRFIQLMAALTRQGRRAPDRAQDLRHLRRRLAAGRGRPRSGRRSTACASMSRRGRWTPCHSVKSTLLTGDVTEAVGRLKRGVGGEIQVHGSGELIQTLVGHDLVDEFHLLVFPVLLGSGKRLFAEGTVPSGLKLVGTTALSTGVLVSTYEAMARLSTVRWARKPVTGDRVK